MAKHLFSEFGPVARNVLSPVNFSFNDVAPDATPVVDRVLNAVGQSYGVGTPGLTQS